MIIFTLSHTCTNIHIEARTDAWTHAHTHVFQRELVTLPDNMLAYI